MNRLISYLPSFLFGAACTIVLAMLLGAAGPDEQARWRDTQIVPIAGGIALMLSIHDHDKDRLYLYQLPVKKGGKVQLRGNVDLSATGQEQLPAELNIAD